MEMKTVTAAIIIRDNKILLARRKEGERLAGYWEFPGGKIEKDETPQTCLERELYEELGVRARAGEVIAESEYHYDHGSIKLLAIRAELLDDNLALQVHDRVEWVDILEIMKYKLAPADVPVALKIMESVKKKS